jgi:hypothetical protein
MKQVFKLLTLGILVFVLVAIPLNAKGKKVEKQEQEILEVLRKFQAGYTERDTSKLDKYMDEIFDPDDCLAIGTSTYGPGTGDWSEGIDEVEELVKFDWLYWGNLKMKIEEARIQINGNTAWVAMWGTSEGRRVKKDKYDRTLEEITLAIKLKKEGKSKRTPLDVLLWSNQYISRILYELERDDYFIHPLRITAVLVKKKGKWLIRLIDFAFPSLGMPDVRTIKNGDKE